MKETSGNGYSKAEQLRLREASDRLCREYGLSVIEKLRKAPSRPVWLDEKNGKPTRYNVYRADVREAMEFSRTPYYQYGFRGYLVVITGTMTQNAITIKADGGKTELGTLFNVDIQMSSGSASKTTGQGAVTLELNGTNIAKSNTGGAGIQKMNTDWLVIQDNSTPDDSLTAAGGDYTAGIGGS